MADDFLQMAVGALEGFQSVYLPRKKAEYEDVLARRRKQEEIQAEEESKIRVAEQTPREVWNPETHTYETRYGKGITQIPEVKSPGVPRTSSLTYDQRLNLIREREKLRPKPTEKLSEEDKLAQQLFRDSVQRLQIERQKGDLTESTMTEVDRLGERFGYKVERVIEEIDKDPNWVQKVLGITPSKEQKQKIFVTPSVKPQSGFRGIGLSERPQITGIESEMRRRGLLK